MADHNPPSDNKELIVAKVMAAVSSAIHSGGIANEDIAAAAIEAIVSAIIKPEPLINGVIEPKPIGVDSKNNPIYAPIKAEIAAGTKVNCYKPTVTDKWDQFILRSPVQFDLDEGSKVSIGGSSYRVVQKFREDKFPILKQGRGYGYYDSDYYHIGAIVVLPKGTEVETANHLIISLANDVEIDVRAHTIKLPANTKLQHEDKMAPLILATDFNVSFDYCAEKPAVPPK